MCLQVPELVRSSRFSTEGISVPEQPCEDMTKSRFISCRMRTSERTGPGKSGRYRIHFFSWVV